MARLRHSPAYLKKTSSKSSLPVTLRVKLNDQEFEAIGNADNVTKLFHEFLQVLPQIQKSTPTQNLGHAPHALTIHEAAKSRQSVLHRIFQYDDRSAALIFRSSPPANELIANLVLLILLGYQELRLMKEVPATTIIQALKCCSPKITRLDREVKTYVAERLIVKGGRGKGGFYRLTGQGVEKAREKAQELAAVL